ncbi:MAG TPA: hypothetical protein VLY63_07755 [Anaerolineae bacterium]|nr:hypothetical protein [Anaerolineae bacterium]
MTVRPSHRILEGIWVSIVRIGLAGGLASPHPAAATAPLDSADYTFVYPNLPDPAIWSVSSQGNVTQVPVEGAGLAMADPDNSNPDNDSRFDAALGGSGGYIYNLSGRDLSTGTWTLQFTASGDPVSHSVRSDIR